MKKKELFVILSVILLLCHPACSQSPSTTRENPKIAATIFPLYDITRNVVGDKFEVLEVLPPGASPHTYELTPQQVKRLQGVVLVFNIGHGLDEWTNSIVDILPDVKKITVDKGIRLKRSSLSEEHEQVAEEHHEHEGMNPHYWLSVSNAGSIAKNVAEEAIQLDPENEEFYRVNLEEYLSKLNALKKEIESRLSRLDTRKMITFHDSWLYYADEFGLEIVAAFEPFPGKQPTPRYLAELQREIREHKVTGMFSEPQLSAGSIEQFVSDMGLKLYVLDPLGGIEGRDSYIELLQYNTNVIVGAFFDER